MKYIGVCNGDDGQRAFRRIRRYFLVLVAAFNLFFAFGYSAYSGFEPNWPWRVLLVVVAVAGYYGSMRLLAREIAPFAKTAGISTGALPNLARIRRITLVPYIASMVLACPGGSVQSEVLADHAHSRAPSRSRLHLA